LVLSQVNRASMPTGNILMVPATVPTIGLTCAHAIMYLHDAQAWHAHNQVATCYSILQV